MAKQKIMLIAGCSHAAGSEIDGSPDSLYNRNHCFGNLLATELGYVPINLSIAGNSNSGIARSVLKWFEANYNSRKMTVSALVSWTDSTRLEIPVDRIVDLPDCDYINWLDVTAQDFYRVPLGWHGDEKTPGEVQMTKTLQRFIVDNEMFLEILSLNYALQLQYFFNANNIKFMMCNSMPIYRRHEKHLGFYMSMIDSTKYYGLHNPESAFYNKYKELGYKNSKATYWHHDEVPHDLFYQELLYFAKENKCF